MKNQSDIQTRLIHAGHERTQHYGASSVPIYQVSTYHQEDPENLGRYDYARSDNPTREALEKSIAELEGGVRGFAFASGMAAVSSVLLMFASGDHIVVSDDVYGGTFRVLTTLLNRWGLKYTFVDSTKIENIEAAITPATRAIFVETPSNPILRVTDLKAVANCGKKHGLLTIVDNTFMTPLLQRPLDFGFDIVVHSATKFIGGHSDLIAGLVVVKTPEIGYEIRRVQNSLGAILGPQDSWLALRGLKTLEVRMSRQQESAERLALWLQNRAEVRRVYYPTLTGHQGRETHLRQATGGGAVLAFELNSREAAVRFMKKLQLPLVAVSLGGVESILSYPATMSHAAMPREERLARGIGDELVRLSVGLEAVEDLMADLQQALILTV